jgi:hypothetical protein
VKPRSAKNKGVRLQNTVAMMLYNRFDALRAGDIKTAIMGESGIDIVLSPTAQDLIPLDIECKNTEKLNIWKALQQAEANTSEGRIPAVVFKRNRSKIYIAMELEEYLKERS